MSAKPNKQQVKRVNAAFEKMRDDIRKYLKTCCKNNSPVKGVRVNVAACGDLIGVSVRYYSDQKEG